MTTDSIISKAWSLGITLRERAAPQTTEADIETNLGKAEALRQAILKKALCGRARPAGLVRRTRLRTERATETKAKPTRARRLSHG
jgi:hypothetical protein